MNSENFVEKIIDHLEKKKRGSNNLGGEGPDKRIGKAIDVSKAANKQGTPVRIRSADDIDFVNGRIPRDGKGCVELEQKPYDVENAVRGFYGRISTLIDEMILKNQLLDRTQSEDLATDVTSKVLFDLGLSNHEVENQILENLFRLNKSFHGRLRKVRIVNNGMQVEYNMKAEDAHEISQIYALFDRLGKNPGKVSDKQVVKAFKISLRRRDFDLRRKSFAAMVVKAGGEEILRCMVGAYCNGHLTPEEIRTLNLIYPPLKVKDYVIKLADGGNRNAKRLRNKLR